MSAAWSPFSLLTLSMSPSAELRHASPREAVEASGEVPDAQAPCAAHTSSLALADASGFLLQNGVEFGVKSPQLELRQPDFFLPHGCLWMIKSL